MRFLLIPNYEWCEFNHVKVSMSLWYSCIFFIISMNFCDDYIISSVRNELGLLERVCGRSISSIIHQQIRQHIDHTCKGNFESSYINTLEKVSFQQSVNFVKIGSVYLELSHTSYVIRKTVLPVDILTSLCEHRLN